MLARSCLALALGFVVLAGCGDDEKDERQTDNPGQDPTGMGGGDIDGGIGLDASTDGPRDATVLPDGRVIGADAGDGGCDLIDPQFGCGRGTGTLVRFDDGLEIDRASGLAWAPAMPASGELGVNADQGCEGLSIGGIDEFTLPTIDQVRTLAAGCPASEPGGSCTVAHETCVGLECGTNAQTCKPCEVGKGPHESGGYCRPELAECVTAWSLTACDDNGPTASCPAHRHWFYDVKTGSFGLSQPNSKLAGRCVARIAAPTPGPAPAPVPAARP